MDEKIFFNDENVTVSNARFIVHGQTYAMNGVTSVKQSVRQPSGAWPAIFIAGGCLVMFAGGAAVVCGVLLIVIGVIWRFLQKPVWMVILNSSSGETQALTSQDKGHIDTVISALNDSIVHRG
jgi:hypothetical protein